MSYTFKRRVSEPSSCYSGQNKLIRKVALIRISLKQMRKYLFSDNCEEDNNRVNFEGISTSILKRPSRALIQWAVGGHFESNCDLMYDEY